MSWYGDAWNSPFNPIRSMYKAGASSARGMDPANPYNTAAGGAMEASRRSEAFAGTQWDRSQQGLAGALGQMGGSTAYAYNAGMGPQASGQAYQNASNYFGQPSNMAWNYGGMSSQLGQPSAMSGAYGSGQQRIGGTTAQQSLYNGTPMGSSYAAGAYNPGAYSQPGAMERAGAYGVSQLGQPGQFEQAAGGLASRMSDAPSYLSRLYSENWGGYGTQGRSEGYNPPATGYAQGYAGDAAQRMSGPTATQQAAGGIGGLINSSALNLDEARGMFRDSAINQRSGEYFGGATNLQSFGEKHLPGMEREGDFEQFARSALTGDNPAIARAREQGMEALNQQMAARGRFNSGAAGYALGNFASDMAAKEWEFKGQMADRAQQARMQRLGQAQNLAGAMSGERMGQGAAFLDLDRSSAANRLQRAGALQGVESSIAGNRLARAGAFQGLAGQIDEGAFRREDALARAAGMASGESLANTGNEMAANEAADRTRLARLSGMAGLAGAADTGNLSQLNAAAGVLGAAQQAGNQRLSTMGSLANMAQGSELSRLGAGMSAASSADAGALGRLGMGLNYAQGADQSTLAASLGLGSMAGQLDAGTLARLNAQWGMGRDVDQYGAQGMATMGSLANAYDSQFRGSQGDLFDMLFRSDGSRAGLYGGFYGQGMQSSGQAYTDSTNAYANAMGLTGQGQGARQEAIMNLLSWARGMG